MSNPEQLDGRHYFHGTSASSAVCIAVEGFQLLERRLRFWRGALGTGIYVTRNLKEALSLGDVQSFTHTYVLLVEFTPGTRIARLNDQPDQRVLKSLRREFGQEILGYGFAQAIPPNKRLRPRELFALLGHLQRSNGLDEETTLRQVRRWLLRLHYHGYGHTENDLGIMLFDPSRLLLRDVKRLPRWAVDRYPAPLDRSALLAATPDDIATEAEAELRQQEAYYDDPDDDYEAQHREIERRRQLLIQFKQERCAKG